MGAYVPKAGEVFEERYELLEMLGVGGIGTVFKAKQIDSGRFIALKIMHSGFAEDEIFKQRFLREGRSLNNLSHPNVVGVYHLGVSTNGLPYLAMELIEGQPLRRLLLDQKRIPPEKAIHICKQLCSALDAMHKEGIVHRDLKPDNIVIVQIPEPDFVKIIDFGLVRRVEGQRESQRLTATGVVLGSPAYMSPEQCKGQKVDFRSDIYAVSVCMFEMLTGRTPFASENFVELMYKHAKEAVPAIEASILGPYQNGVNVFLQKGMSKDPNLRFQSAQEMLDYLENEELLKSGGNASQLSSGMVKTIALCALLPILFGLALFYLYRHTQEQEAAGSVKLSPRIQDSIKNRHLTADNLKLLKDEDLWLAAENPNNPDDVKCQAYLMYAWNRRTTKDGLDAAVKASALYEKMKDRGVINDTLSFATQLTLAESSYCNKKSDESVACLKALLAKPVPPQFPPQAVLRAKALLVQMYSEKGMTDKAIALLKEVTNWVFGLAYPASSYAMAASLRLKRYDLAKKALLQMSTLGAIADAARLSRIFHQPQVGQMCIEHGKAQIKSTTVNLQTVEKEPLTDAMFNFKIEESWLDIYAGNIATAKKRVMALSRKTPAIELIKKSSYYAFPLALIMRNLNMFEDAITVAGQCSAPDPQLKLLTAELYVLQGKLEQAKAYLPADYEINDPETGKLESAEERWRLLKEGKGDCTKGLCNWTGMYKQS